MIKSYHILEEAITHIISESASHFPNETGGLLVGKVENDYLLVRFATGPGPAAQHAPALFKRDGDFSQTILDTLVKNSDGELDYMGEWHSHPFKAPPSQIDLESMKWIAASEEYAIKQPAMLLCIGAGLNRWELRCYVLAGKRLKLLPSVSENRQP